jgi:hypothetical protein
MKQIIALATLAVSALVPTLAHAGLDSDNPIHPLVGVAITGGGDKIASVEYANGGSRDITAGGLVQLSGGIEYHEKGQPWGVQATVGYHFDNTSADNGNQRFQRWPLEVIGLFNLTPKFRMGVGARYAAAAKFTSDGAGYVGNADFKAQLGGLVMAEWLITPSMGVQLRFVDEKYKVDETNLSTGTTRRVTVDGSHGGLGFNYYF